MVSGKRNSVGLPLLIFQKLNLFVYNKINDYGFISRWHDKHSRIIIIIKDGIRALPQKLHIVIGTYSKYSLWTIPP